MDPFVGEIRIFSWDWAPKGWLLCNGASLPMSQYQALYALLGQTFGGSGTNFNLPDLRGRTPINYGYGADGHAYQMGEKGGAETVQLQITNLPAHNHTVSAVAATKGNVAGLNGNFPATVGYNTGKTAASNIYASPQNAMALAADSVSIVGGGGAHQNMQPFAVVNYCIASTGVFPPRN